MKNRRFDKFADFVMVAEALASGVPATKVAATLVSGN